MLDYNKYLKGICLVAGTCIGAGMIGLPVKTATAGLLPILGSLGFVCFIMIASALLLLEAALAFPHPVNFVSMSHAIFGKMGKKFAWLICLLFMYAVMAAYAAGGAGIFYEFLPHLDLKITVLFFMVPFMLIVYLGAEWVSRINRLLIVGVIGSFIILCSSMLLGSGGKLQPLGSLWHFGQDLKILLRALPLIVVMFSYHEIIPPLATFLQGQVKPLKAAIILGTTIPLIVYIIWQFVALLLIPTFGQEGLAAMLFANKNPGSSLIDYIGDHYPNKLILGSFASFSFFALSCSLTGTAWALFDFFADGCNIDRSSHKNKLLLGLITFGPPVIYTMLVPEGFLKALNIAGALSAIIMIIYPVLMVWKLRRSAGAIGAASDPKDHLIEQGLNKKKDQYRAPFGKLMLGIILVFGVVIVGLELAN